MKRSYRATMRDTKTGEIKYKSIGYNYRSVAGMQASNWLRRRELKTGKTESFTMTITKCS